MIYAESLFTTTNIVSTIATIGFISFIASIFDLSREISGMGDVKSEHSNN